MEFLIIQNNNGLEKLYFGLSKLSQVLSIDYLTENNENELVVTIFDNYVLI